MKTRQHIVRIGPLTILSMVIVLGLTTMAVLSFTTARASQLTASKQADSIQALYVNERAGQEFLAQVDEELARIAGSTTNAQDAAAGVRSALKDSDGAGNEVSAAFTAGNRTLTVVVAIQDDLTYSIKQWSSEAKIESKEDTHLWQGA